MDGRDRLSGKEEQEGKLFLYATGELEGDEALSFERELAASPELRRELERYERLVVLLRAAAEEEIRAPGSLSGRVNRRVAISSYLKAATGLVEGVLGMYGRAVLYYLRTL
ncbi:anti-sigma factor family protein [Rubrobacter radiotolerans]|nr:hypothetical protein [Rubrobacter radiotolerans]SMC02836.1 hypothetical protein SAMN00767673_0276 [Rubrobacter radiotolerans DSM 5868]